MADGINVRRADLRRAVSLYLGTNDENKKAQHKAEFEALYNAADSELQAKYKEAKKLIK